MMLAMREIVPGLFRIGLRGKIGLRDSAYVLRAGNETVLIDTGSPKVTNIKKIEDGVRRANGTGAIDHILITHYHLDHIGNLAEIVAGTGAKVWVPQGDMHIIKAGGRPPDLKPQGMSGWILSRIVLMHEQEGRPVDEPVIAGQRLDVAGGIQVIDTSGHTGGHVAFLWPEHGGVLFTGDAASNIIRLGPMPLNEDQRRAEESFGEMSGRVFEVAVFGHGRPITKGASDRFKRAARSISRRA